MKHIIKILIIMIYNYNKINKLIFIKLQVNYKQYYKIVNI